MSHKLEIHNVTLNVQKLREMLRVLPDALAGWKVNLEETVRFFDRSRISGISLKPPTWTEKMVVDATGKIHYDIYGGNWGNMADVAKLAALALAYESGGDVQRAKVQTDAEGWMTVEAEVSDETNAGIFADATSGEISVTL